MTLVRNAVAPILAVIFIISLILFDLGNPSAPRQGTEGFYLKVSKETYNAGNVLTPIYFGQPHWSKPPLLFLMPFSLYSVTKSGDLWSARFAVLACSLLMLSLLVYIFKDIDKQNFKPLELFLYLSSSLVFLKYSRIFMNESLLLFLPLISNLFLFKYWQMPGKMKYLLSAILLAAIGSYSKGPVSIVGQILPSMIFLLIINKRQLLPFILKFVLPISLLSSLWIIYEWHLYGEQFIQYFFIRENLGKFTSKSYPLHVVFLGLFVFSLPWSLIFLQRKNFYIDLKNFFLNYKSNHLVLYLTLHTIILTLLWTIPSQRSHHYAVPASGHFLLLIYCLMQQFEISLKPIQFIQSIIATIFVLITLALGWLEMLPLANLAITACSFAIMIIFWRSGVSKIGRTSLVSLVLVSQLWILLGPAVYLPLVPNEVADKVSKNDELFVSFRKPYYIEEILERPVKAIDPAAVDHVLQSQSSFLLLAPRTFISPNLLLNVQIIATWPTWARGVSIRQIWSAIQEKDFKKLQVEMILVRKL